jgi:hypothetical protein
VNKTRTVDNEAGAPKYAGMTVNERLFVAGVLDEFERAAFDRDRAAMISVLQRVELPSNQAAETTDTILSNPKRYGY